MSVALQPTTWVPTMLVLREVQLWMATPDRTSVALGLAVELPPSRTGLGEMVGARLGGVTSMLMPAWVAEAAFPALSLQALPAVWLAPSVVTGALTVDEAGPDGLAAQPLLTV